LQRQSDLGLHIDEFLLNQLIGGERTAKLLALEHVVPRGVPAILGRAERAPGNPVSRGIEARERSFQSAHAR
jgi:hypothetical protein